MEPWESPHVRRILENILRLVPEAYLVGGAVRDPILGRPSPVDLDLAVNVDGFALARQLASEYGRGATFVPLDQSTGTGRIVLWDGVQATLDISSLKGPTIQEDLFERDFTINALAIAIRDFHRGVFHSVVDPTGGLEDLRSGRIRACAASTFQSDPLRILRAFRFRASLGFQVTEGTRELMIGSVRDLTAVSPERIRDELFAVLTTSEAAPILEEMDALGILAVVFPETNPMRACPQNRYHHLDVWSHTIEAIRKLEEIVRYPGPQLGEFAGLVQPYVQEELVPTRSKGALLKLAALFHDAGKPHTMTVDQQDRIRFFGHEKISREIFENMATRLKLARREIKLAGEWVGGHMRTMIFTRETVSKRAIYRLHRAFGQDIMGLLLLFLADLSATRGPASEPRSEAEVFHHVREALDETLKAREKGQKPFLNGREIMALFGIPPGPGLGAILRQLEDLQGIGEIQNREEAMEAASRIVEEDHATE